MKRACLHAGLTTFTFFIVHGNHTKFISFQCSFRTHFYTICILALHTYQKLPFPRLIIHIYFYRCVTGSTFTRMIVRTRKFTKKATITFAVVYSNFAHHNFQVSPCLKPRESPFPPPALEFNEPGSYRLAI